MAKKPEMKRLKIELIRRDSSTQARAGCDEETIEQYREVYTDLPPPKVCVDDEGIYWLWDGFATVEAYVREGRKQIECQVWPGTHENARWRAAGANVDHDFAGRRRTNADKQRAVEVALSCPSAVERTTQEIADHCRVSYKTVQRARQAIGKTVLSGGKVDKVQPPQISETIGSGGGAATAIVSAGSKKTGVKKKKASSGSGSTKKKSPSKKPGASTLSNPDVTEDVGHHDDPQWLHGTRKDMRDGLLKDAQLLLTVIGRIDKRLSRIGANTGQAAKILESMAKDHYILAAIIRGLS